MANAITKVITWLSGDLVGKDSYGNVYYQQKKEPEAGRRRRWIIYANGNDEASNVPPEYNAWLHYTSDMFPDQETRHRHGWEKDHLPNMTGTTAAYRPPGHTLKGGNRDSATGDYEAWSPE